jgi:hypothetical protein
MWRHGGKMLFSKRFTIKTADSTSEVAAKLKQVIETESCPLPKSYYKGAFGHEGFLILPKWPTSASGPLYWIGGKYVNGEQGTNIVFEVHFTKLPRIVFVAANLFLLLIIWKSSRERLIALGFVAWVWFFGIFQMWLATKYFRKLIEPLFREQKEADAENTVK